MTITFVALDFETANANRASACSLGIVKVIDGVLVDKLSMNFRPPSGFDAFTEINISIHGITPEMVRGEKRFGQIWPKFADFIEGFPVIAHNASFDLSVLRNSLTASDLKWPSIEYACTMVMSRKVFNLTSYSLPYVAQAAGVDWLENKHHEADFDAEICAKIAIEIAKDVGVNNIDNLLEKLVLSKGVLSADGWTTCRNIAVIPTSRDRKSEYKSAKDIEVNWDSDQAHPLYGQVVVFTGQLDSMSRKEAWLAIAQIGAIPSDYVTKSTNIIVVGMQDILKLRPGETKSVKFRDAEKLKSKGQEIEVIGERDFLSWLEPVYGYNFKKN